MFRDWWWLSLAIIKWLHIHIHTYGANQHLNIIQNCIVILQNYINIMSIMEVLHILCLTQTRYTKLVAMMLILMMQFVETEWKWIIHTHLPLMPARIAWSLTEKNKLVKIRCLENHKIISVAQDLQCGFCECIKQNTGYYAHCSILCTTRGNDAVQQVIYASFIRGLLSMCFFISQWFS